jgi:hypothetical protein
MKIENEIRICRVCNLGSDITKFIIKNNKIYGKRCCKCNSIANNERLKNKHYYTEYYLKNKDNKEKNKTNNLVVFDFENYEKLTTNDDIIL